MERGIAGKGKCRCGENTRGDREDTMIYLLLAFILFGMGMALLRRPPRARWILVGVAIVVLVGAFLEWGVLASGFLPDLFR